MKKAPSYRTRRRKIQNELEAFDYLDSSNILETDNLDRNTISTEIPLNNAPTELQISSPEVAYNRAYNAMDTNTVKNLFVNNKEEIIKQSLGQWAVDCNVPQSTVNKLLNILKFETPLTFLPKDCRTLLKTGSSKILNIRDVKPGNYYHFGLRNGIIKYSSILPLSAHIKIAVGVDGLPISKSSSGQLCPILAYIIPYHDCVFPVGIYYGFLKPLDSNDFLYVLR